MGPQSFSRYFFCLWLDLIRDRLETPLFVCCGYCCMLLSNLWHCVKVWHTWNQAVVILVNLQVGQAVWIVLQTSLLAQKPERYNYGVKCRISHGMAYTFLTRHLWYSTKDRFMVKYVFHELICCVSTTSCNASDNAPICWPDFLTSGYSINSSMFCFKSVKLASGWYEWKNNSAQKRNSAHQNAQETEKENSDVPCLRIGTVLNYYFLIA